jgi:excisionase family DNA binding protein
VTVEGLTVLEVAARLHVTPLTVWRWLKAGSLYGTHCEDRAGCRVRESDLAAFLDARRRGGVQDRTPSHSPAS